MHVGGCAAIISSCRFLRCYPSRFAHIYRMPRLAVHLEIFTPACVSHKSSSSISNGLAFMYGRFANNTFSSASLTSRIKPILSPPYIHHFIHSHATGCLSRMYKHGQTAWRGAMKLSSQNVIEVAEAGNLRRNPSCMVWRGLTAVWHSMGRKL